MYLLGLLVIWIYARQDNLGNIEERVIVEGNGLGSVVYFLSRPDPKA
jgi:hypothetical protein